MSVLGRVVRWFGFFVGLGVIAFGAPSQPWQCVLLLVIVTGALFYAVRDAARMHRACVECQRRIDDSAARSTLPAETLAAYLVDASADYSSPSVPVKP